MRLIADPDRQAERSSGTSLPQQEKEKEFKVRHTVLCRAMVKISLSGQPITITAISLGFTDE
jgi:hypothetical protein